ncbi:SDR family oxidoreductase [Rhodoferax sp.]|uniref:SDR family oxidoreductase n=1 Tax=Rhodoferax sp. TaxID=50421 RepID=UPI00374DB6EE
MRVFVTGATGFIGSAVVPELLHAGHQVLGLARSDAGAQALRAMGAEVLRGDLDDLDGLRKGAAESDGVVHAAFNHDFSKFAENSAADKRAIEVIGSVLEGSDRPLVVTAGIFPTSGRPTTEDDAPPSGHGGTPRLSEQTALALVERGVRASVVRLSQIHDRDRHGLVSYLMAIAREKGISAYVGTGLNRWPAAHRLDAAPVYRLALERGTAGARYQVVGEEGVPLRDIAEAIGRGFKIPVVALSAEEAPGHFGWLAFFAGMDAPASSLLTQQRLGWRPVQPAGMRDDLDHASAFAV